MHTAKRNSLLKMSIALKEAAETAYWLELLVESDYITQGQFAPLFSRAEELVKLLTSIVKTSKSD